jgi:PAS domain S-box
MIKVDQEINSVLDGIGDFLFILDRNMVILKVNKATCDFLGKKQDEIIGKHCYEVVHGTDCAFPECPAVKTLETKSVVSGEIKDSAINVPLLITTSPIFDESGEIIRIIHLAKDISEAKAAYRKIKVANEKLQVLSNLTRHDVRNKLSAITTHVYLLKKKYGDHPDILNALQVMAQAVTQSEDIFNFADMYEQLGIEELAYIDVEAIINEASKLFSQAPTITNECVGLKILADSCLRQLFYNFIDNTIAHGEKATTSRIYYQQNPESLLLVYEDNGVGVPVQNKSLIFEKGFSTGGSTGYGLFLVKKMTDLYGWQIEETGEAGKGARFVITIPHFGGLGQVNYRISP